MSDSTLTPEQEQLAARIADQAKASGSSNDGVGKNDDDTMSINLAHLGRIASAYRAAQTLPESPVSCLFEWRHLKVERELDHGGFGTVYEAWDPVLKRRVALKLIQEDRITEQRDRSMIVEAQRMASVRHANVLAVHGADVADGRTGIWSDLLEGMNLQQTVKEGRPLSTQQVTAMAVSLADALGLIHRSGIVHGDIKPANIMIQPDGMPILMDFGSSPGSSFGQSSYGSPLVMAPEQFTGQPATRACDIYGLGATLYFALKGRFPVEANSLEALEKKHRNAASIDFSGLTARWRRVLRSMLKRDPELRPTVSDTEKSFAAIAEAKPRLIRRVAVGLVMGSLVMGALAAVMAYQSEEESRKNTEQMKRLVIDSLEASLPNEQSGQPSLESVYQRMSELADERLANNPLGLVEIKRVAAMGFGQLGLVDRALAVATESHDLLLTLPDVGPVILSSSWLTQSSLLKDNGELAGAAAAANEAIKILEDAPVNDETTENRLIVYNRLAAIQGRRGDHHASIIAYQKSLELRRRAYGENDARLAVSYHNIASSQAAVGQYANAIENEQASARVLEQVGDGNSVRMGYVLQGLAHTLAHSGRYEESLPVFDRARALLLVSLPEDHPRLHSLKMARWVAEYHVGNTDGVVQRVTQMAQSPDTVRQNQFRANRILGDLALHEGRWQAAIDAYGVVVLEENARMTNERPYFHAAIAFSRFQLDPSLPSPLVEIQSVLNRWREDRLTGFAYFQILLSWERDLLR
ncbi:MAG: serine/threonine-protein kinase [Lysobacterales bacterium]